MSVQLDHTIVPARDKHEAAAFLARILDLPEPVAIGPFVAVEIDHGLTLDFADADGEIRPMHYAFRVDEAEFDAVFDRVVTGGLPYWADPSRSRPGQVAQRGAGRGFYFEDPSGHFLEVLTR
ncbi:MAG TPA: VOC family protein [Acidimicrobiia bacterium]|nr:VOC family protein [Acidimicrobiia bacterium]